MIKTFVHKGLEAFFFEGTKKGIQPKYAQRIGDILDLLDAAEEVGDMNFPGQISIPSKELEKAVGR